MKVYCIDCKYCLYGGKNKSLCYLTESIDYIGEKTYSLCIFVRNGDTCKDFKPRFFKRWKYRKCK
jgi:hypothetical protein